MFMRVKRAVWKSCKVNWWSKIIWIPIYIWATTIKTQPSIKWPMDTKTSRCRTKREEDRTVLLMIATCSNRKWSLAWVERHVSSESIQPAESKVESWIWTTPIKDNYRVKWEAIEVAPNKLKIIKQVIWIWSFSPTIRKSITSKITLLSFSITRETWATWVSTVRA